MTNKRKKRKNKPSPQQHQERTIKSDEARKMSEMMQMFNEVQAQEHNKGDEVLSKLIEKEVSAKDRFSSLMTIGATSLLPDNQPMEQRFLQIAQKIVGVSTPTTIKPIDLKKSV